jgi:hypothetical protein
MWLAGSLALEQEVSRGNFLLNFFRKQGLLENELTITNSLSGTQAVSVAKLTLRHWPLARLGRPIWPGTSFSIPLHTTLQSMAVGPPWHHQPNINDLAAERGQFVNRSQSTESNRNDESSSSEQDVSERRDSSSNPSNPKRSRATPSARYGLVP